MTTLLSNVFNGSVTVTGQAPSFVTTPQIDGELVSGATIEVSSFTYAGTEPVTITYQRGAVVGGDIGGATSPSYVQTDSDYGKTFYWRVTITNSLGSSSYTATASAITGKVFTEDWSAFTVGDIQTELLAGGYTRNSTSWACNVIASASLSPSGKAISYNTSASATRYATRTDIDTFGAANVTSIYEELFLLEHTSGSTPTFFLRGLYRDTGTQAPGINIRQDVVKHQVDGDDVAADSGVTLATLTADQKVYIRSQIEGATSRVRIWDYGEAEPGLWTSTRSHANGTTPRCPSLGVRVLGGSETIHFYSVGFDAAAPYPDGYVPPSAETGDLLTAATPASSTSITMGSGDIVWSFEDA